MYIVDVPANSFCSIFSTIMIKLDGMECIEVAGIKSGPELKSNDFCFDLVGKPFQTAQLSALTRLKKSSLRL